MYQLRNLIGAVMVMIIWSLDLKLHMQSVSITTNVVSSNPTQDLIQHYVIQFVSGFLWVLRFPPPIYWPPQYNWNIVEKGV